MCLKIRFKILYYINEDKEDGSMKQRKNVALVLISVAAIIVLVSTLVITQVFMKTNVIEQVSQSQEKSEVPKALDVSSWDTSKVTIYTDASGKKAPIPARVCSVTGNWRDRDRYWTCNI